MKKLAVIIAAVVGMSTVANAVSVSIAVGDQPYYVHGPGYWVGPAYYVWVPGHWVWHHHHEVWVHGQYRVR
jgi:hypothetical protein